MASEQSGIGTTPPTGLFGSLKRLAGTFVSLLKTRLELVSTEIEEERERIKEIVLLAVIALFCMSLGVLLLTLLIVVAFWNTYRLYVLSGFVIFYLGLGLIAGLVMRRKVISKPRLFSGTLSELAKDRESLKF